MYTANDLLQTSIRGIRFTEQITVTTKLNKLTYPATDTRTLVTLSYQLSQPGLVKARFPLGMNGDRHFEFPLLLLEKAVYSAVAVGAHNDSQGADQDYICFTPAVEEEFEHGSDEGLMLEFKVAYQSKYKIWLPLDKLTDFVSTVFSACGDALLKDLG